MPPEKFLKIEHTNFPLISHYPMPDDSRMRARRIEMHQSLRGKFSIQESRIEKHEGLINNYKCHTLKLLISLHFLRHLFLPVGYRRKMAKLAYTFYQTLSLHFAQI